MSFSTIEQASMTKVTTECKYCNIVCISHFLLSVSLIMICKKI